MKYIENGLPIIIILMALNSDLKILPKIFCLHVTTGQAYNVRHNFKHYMFLSTVDWKKTPGLWDRKYNYKIYKKYIKTKMSHDGKPYKFIRACTHRRAWTQIIHHRKVKCNVCVEPCSVLI